jgi:hypothetical protein
LFAALGKVVDGKHEASDFEAADRIATLPIAVRLHLTIEGMQIAETFLGRIRGFSVRRAGWRRLRGEQRDGPPTGERSD